VRYHAPKSWESQCKIRVCWGACPTINGAHPFVLLGFRALHARGRATRDGVQLIEGVTEGRESREFAPGGGEGELVAFIVLAPCDHMGRVVRQNAHGRWMPTNEVRSGL
jgi:hypothetical protein